jgi:hypothetical protein
MRPVGALGGRGGRRKTCRGFAGKTAFVSLMERGKLGVGCGNREDVNGGVGALCSSGGMGRGGLHA